MRLTTKQVAKLIRFALKKRCKTLKVRMARGTAYGNIDIWAGDSSKGFTPEEKAALEYYGLPHCANCAGVSYDEREYWIKRMCQLDPEVEAYYLSLILQNHE